MNIKNKLLLIQKLSGLTQEKLASALETSFPTLNSWINGRSVPRDKAAARIDEFYLRLTGQNVVPEGVLEAKKQAVFVKRKGRPEVLRFLGERKDLYDALLLALTYNTNRIEGSTLTEPDTAAILFKNTALPDKSIIEQMEVKNHQAAFGHLVRHMTARGKISEEFVLKLHGILMNGIKEDAGQYRSHAVRIAGSHVPTANYLKIHVLMRDLMKEVQNPGNDVIGFAAQTHSRFEQIHPFSDGNGRVGRLLLVAMLLREDFAPAVIKQETRHFYILYLNKAQQKGDTSLLEDFVCEAIFAGYELLL